METILTEFLTKPFVSYVLPEKGVKFPAEVHEALNIKQKDARSV